MFRSSFAPYVVVYANEFALKLPCPVSENAQLTGIRKTEAVAYDSKREEYLVPN